MLGARTSLPRPRTRNSSRPRCTQRWVCRGGPSFRASGTAATLSARNGFAPHFFIRTGGGPRTKSRMRNSETRCLPTRWCLACLNFNGGIYKWSRETPECWAGGAEAGLQDLAGRERHHVLAHHLAGEQLLLFAEIWERQGVNHFQLVIYAAHNF